MQKPSVKHHYLPRYYLKGFTDDKGRFYVYDKREDRIFQTSPDNSFFENHLNTITFSDGDTSDSLEGLYERSEQLVWPALDAIRASTPASDIDELDQMHLYLFLLTLHWRLPSNIPSADRLAEQAFRGDGGPLSFLRLKNPDGRRPPEEITGLIRSSNAFKKYMRLMAPMVPFFSDKNWTDDLTNWRFLYTGDSQRWHIVGDNPIITRGLHDADPLLCLKEFIVPISGNILLVNTQPPIDRNFPPQIVIRYSGALIERCERFVACRDEEFLKSLVDYYKLNRANMKTDTIIAESFRALHEIT